MASEKQYRVVTGIVQFPPRDGEANGKAVRNIAVRQAGFGDQNIRVSATLWPPHAHIKVDEGDYVALEGTYTPNTVKKDDGTKVTYHNVSVLKFAVLAATDPGKDVETDGEDVEDDADSDEIPF